MADTVDVNIENNGFRNVVLRCTLVSDGSGVTAQKIYDATATGVYGVSVGGQTFYPGIHTTIVGLDYDVQDMRLQLLWEATANVNIFALGNSAQDFGFKKFGGIRVPAGLVGATGSILVTTLQSAPNSVCSFVLRLRKNVPQG